MNKLGKKICLWWLVIVLFAGSCFAAKSSTQSDLAGVASEERFAGQDKNKRYFLIGGGERAQAPGEGFGLVIVLPGSEDGADFNAFVKRIYKRSLSEESEQESYFHAFMVFRGACGLRLFSAKSKVGHGLVYCDVGFQA
jgi:hypothetical protein